MEPVVNMEELHQELEILKSECETINREGKQLEKQIRELDKLIDSKSRILRNKEKRIAKIKNILATQNIFDEETITKFTDFHLLSDDELKEITKGIDKTDYTAYGKPKIMDLENVVNFVLKIKMLYPSWKLELLQKIARIDIKPPENIYEYTFITQEGFRFIYGGL